MVRPLAVNAARLQIYGGQVLGFGATLCLLGCLAVTPVTRIMRWKRASWWRKWLGLCVFFLGGAGLVIVATGGLRSQSMMDLAGNGQNWTGAVIVIALIPLALTSNRYFQKRLGSYWKTWQYRVTWAAWILLAVHLAVLGAWQTGIAFWMASAPLLAMRIPAVRKDLGRWKSAGYADNARWLLTGLAAGVFACGTGLLLWMEVVACAQAVRLS
jgi:methionine sulfoxide reductase heme-binding subunit